MFLCSTARRRSRQGTSGPATRFRPWLGLILPRCCAVCLVCPDFSSPSAPVAENWLEAHYPPTVTRNFWRDSLALTVNWELDFWGKFRRAIESADAAYLASIANYDYVLVTLLGNVATTYIGIRTLQTQIEIARDNVVKQKKALA